MMGQTPRFCARVAGALYAVTFLAGTIALITRGQGVGAAAGGIAALSYVAVTLILWGLYNPAGRMLSALAAIVSLAGIALGAFALDRLPGGTALPIFGVYVALLGILTLRATFLPRWLAFALFLASAGWLSFLAGERTPLQYAPGIAGEAVFMLYLLANGLDAERWNEQAARARPGGVAA